MPLSERDQGYNEGVAAAAQVLADLSHRYYEALRLIADGSFEAGIVSKRAYALNEYSGSITQLRKRSEEEIAEDERFEEEQEQRELR